MTYEDRHAMTARARRSLAVVVLVVASCLGLASLPTRAVAAESEPDITEAQAAIVVDDTGNELWGTNEYAEMPMASITKIMTAMVAIDSGYSFSNVVTITGSDTGENSQTAGYVAGQTTSFQDLMKVMLVYSANDAAVEVARAVAGSEDAFVAKMNAKAQEIGLTHTHFSDVHGLEADGHYSCVADLVKMGRYAMLNYPFIRQTVKLRSVTVPIGDTEQTFESTDDLMETYEGLLGIKTGSVETGTAFLGCSSRMGVTLYTAVLGCATSEGRFTDTANIMDWAYDTYENRELANTQKAVRYIPYAFCFGYSCVLSADGTVDGCIWPYGEAATYTTVTLGTGHLAVPDQAYSATIYQQNGRVIAACSYSTKSKLVETKSFGPFGTSLFMTGQ